jgi:transposase
MEQSIIHAVGLDMGDRVSHFCILDMGTGAVVERRRCATTREGIRGVFSVLARSRVALEVGTHSAWASREVAECGHEVHIADARRLAFIFKAIDKSDRVDAENLARVVRVDPQLLHPIRHRDQRAQEDLAVLRARDGLVAVRTKLINQVRGLVKSHGLRLADCSTHTFVSRVRSNVPAALKPAIDPLLDVLERVEAEIGRYDDKIEALGKDRYPETALLRAVAGVGSLTSLAYVLVLCDAARFARSRDVGAFVGLTPRRDQSGDRDPQLGITKAGNPFLRRLLVQSGHYILGPFGPDTDLRRFGMSIAVRGGPNAKRRAVVAVARKLAVLLHALWKNGAAYEPLRRAGNAEAGVSTKSAHATGGKEVA